MSKSTKISIVTCTFNSQEFLPKTIASVKKQKNQNFEHIFIDGYSTDSTLQIIEQYRKEYPAQVHLYQQKPSGISNAMNYGVEKATGEVVCHLHSDDQFFDEFVLSRVSEQFADNPDIKWVYGSMVMVDEKGEEYSREVPPDFTLARLEEKNFIPHPSTFIRRSFFQELGGFAGYKLTMDYDLWFRAAKLSAPARIPYFLSKFRRHSGGASTGGYLKTLKEDYQVRLKYTRGKRCKYWLNYRLAILKFHLAKALGRI